jgi:hypothetical protein
LGIKRTEEAHMAALRMKGVVSPQHMPTNRKPKTHRKMDGCGSLATGGLGSILSKAILVYL